MSERRTIPGFWVSAVALAALATHTLGFGVDCWLTWNSSLRPPSVNRAFLFVYQPVWWVHEHGPQPISDAIESYADLWW